MNLKIKLWLLVYYNGGFTLNITAFGRSKASWGVLLMDNILLNIINKY